jgi:hypothetical protein
MEEVLVGSSTICLEFADDRSGAATDHKYCSRTKFSSNGLGIGLATDPR